MKTQIIPMIKLYDTNIKKDIQFGLDVEEI